MPLHFDHFGPLQDSDSSLECGTLLAANDSVLIIIIIGFFPKVTKENIHHKNKMTPYMGMELSGVVEKTIVGGRVAFEKGGVFQAPVGSLLL